MNEQWLNNTSLTEKIQRTIEELNPRLDELAEGNVELLDVDEDKGTVKVKLIGGRLF
jgi:Fe-S cluster biogenesis protein NfuA